MAPGPEGDDGLAPALPAEAPTRDPVPQAFEPALGGVRDLMAGFRASDDRATRALALIRVGRAGDPQARPALEAAARDDDWVMRKYAVSALGALGDPASGPAVRAALDDPHADVRRAAARASRALGALTTADWRVVARDPDWQLRATAIEALGGHADGATREALAAAVADPVWLNRWLAVAGLRALPFGAPALLDALDRDPTIAAPAAEVLAGWASGPGAYPDGSWAEDQADRLRAALLARLPGAPPWKRLALARALGRLPTDDAREALATLVGHPDPEIEDAVLAHGEAMGPWLRAALGDAAWTRRWHAARLLGALADPANGVALLPLVRDPRAEVRLAALEALRRLAPAEGLPDLRAALADPSWHVRLAAVEAIAARAGGASAADLAPALADDREEIRRAAKRALGA
jgi:HEAT repeat protein